MENTITKIFTLSLTSVLSFLGWSPSDYENILPENIKPYVQDIERNSYKKVSNIEPDQNNLKPKNTKDISIKTTDSKKIPPKVVPVKKEIPKEEKDNYLNPKPFVAPPVIKKNTDAVETAPVTPLQKNTENAQIKVKTPEIIPKNNLIPNLSIEEKLKTSVVNIYCVKRINNLIQTITGSAVAVGSDGVYLTNAHVAEYLLLESYLPKGEVSCSLREGSPARETGKLKVVFLPTSWVNENKNNLSLSTPRGTGVNDYALVVLQNTDKNVSYFSLSSDSSQEKDELILLGYPARDGSVIKNALYQSIEKVIVTDTFNFGETRIDALGTSPTTLAHVGSSGGAAVGSDGSLAGIMVATTKDKYTGKKNIRVITTAYIKSDIKKETGETLENIIKNAHERAVVFERDIANKLAKILVDNSR